MTVIGGSLAPFARLSGSNWAEFRGERLPWALETGFKAGNVYSVYWEERLEEDIDDVRAELNIRLLEKKVKKVKESEKSEK